MCLFLIINAAKLQVIFRAYHRASNKTRDSLLVLVTLSSGGFFFLSLQFQKMYPPPLLPTNIWMQLTDMSSFGKIDLINQYCRRMGYLLQLASRHVYLFEINSPRN
jgi:hypothetical protein